MLIVPKGQTITFEDLDCCPADRWCQKVSSSADCQFIENPCLNSLLPAPSPPTGWIVGSGTVIDTNPVRITSTPATNFELRQTVNIPAGDYELHYDYTRNFLPHVLDEFVFQGTATVVALQESLSQKDVKGVQAFTLATPATLLFIMRFNAGINTDVTVRKLYICEPGGQLDEPLCFQVKSESSGMDIQTLDEICFDDTVTDDKVGLFGIIDSQGALPPTNVESVLTTTPTTEAGDYCLRYNVGYISNLGECPSTGDKGSDFILKDSLGPTKYVERCLPFIGSAPSLPMYDGQTVVTLGLGDTIDCEIHTDYEFTDPNYEIDYTYGTTTVSLTALFKSFIFNLQGGLYNICLDLNDYTFVRVIITRQVPLTVVFDKSYTGLQIDDVIFLGAGGDYEVRFEVTECLDTCLENFKIDQLCNPSTQLQDCDGAFITSVIGERSSEPADVGETLNRNELFCYDFLGIAQGAYQIAIFGGPETLLSNCISVCNDLSKQTKFTWSHDKIICQGDCVLDYENYPTTQTLYLRSDKKPAPPEVTKFVTKKSTGFRKTNYAESRSISALEIYDVPDYIREALQLGLCLNIEVDGTLYELAEDAIGITELEGKKFVDIRVLVSEVGDHWIIKDC